MVKVKSATSIVKQGFWLLPPKAVLIYKNPVKLPSLLKTIVKRDFSGLENDTCWSCQLTMTMTSGYCRRSSKVVDCFCVYYKAPHLWSCGTSENFKNIAALIMKFTTDS